MLSFMNGNKHLDFRKNLNKPMSMKSLSSYQKIIEDLVEDLVENFIKESSPDLVFHFTNPLYLELLEKVFGLNIDDKVTFLNDIEISTIITEPLLSINKLKKLQDTYLKLEQIVIEQIIVQKRKGILNDICENLKSEISDKELSVLLMTMVVASRTTTESLVCMLLEYNKLDKNQKIKMISKNWLVENVDHLVRFCASTRYLTRVASMDISFGDFNLKKGEQVLIDVLKANRDKDFYKDEILFSKNPTGKHPHIAFGGGNHICSGLHFAKLVIIQVIPEFFSKIKEFEIQNDKIIYHSSTFAKRIKSCPIKFNNV